MTEIAVPIFIFADDLGVYTGVEDAQRDLEPWFADLVVAAYDRLGNVLVVAADHRVGIRITLADLPTNRNDEFVRRLRDHLLDEVVSYPDRLDERRVEEATESELIEYAVATYRSDPTAGPGFTPGCLGSLLLPPAMILFVIVGGSFAAVAAMARRVKGKR